MISSNLPIDLIELLNYLLADHRAQVVNIYTPPVQSSQDPKFMRSAVSISTIKISITRRSFTCNINPVFMLQHQLEDRLATFAVISAIYIGIRQTENFDETGSLYSPALILFLFTRSCFSFFPRPWSIRLSGDLMSLGKHVSLHCHNHLLATLQYTHHHESLSSV